MKRFYKKVAAEKTGEHWQVTLDGRAIKTQGGRAQQIASPTLADAMAKEWRDQGEELDPKSFPFRDLTDYAIDIAATDTPSLIDKLVQYAETDTLCYRADPHDALFARQQEEWEPILAAIEAREGVQFTRVSGIMHRAQPQETLAKLRTRLESMDAFALAGLQTLASLATSFSIGLEALQPEANAETLWNAANLEELWQEELWGTDPEAQGRREAREREFKSAFEWMTLARAG